MEERGETSAFAVVESLTGWWELAGLDSAVGDVTVDLLASDALTEAKGTAQILPAATKTAERPAAPEIPWPADIAQLREMVSAGAPLPGNGFGPARFPSVGPETCDVMIVSDLPDIWEGSGAGEPNARLLRRMMSAIGIAYSDCYVSWLATSMPPTGEVPEAALPDLGAFMRHQIGIVRPKSVVILGSSARKALLGEELMNARVQLRNINHNGLNIAALATFHPRTLIARPALKTQAWQDLQMFAKRATE